jgi:hypothetical protein
MEKVAMERNQGTISRCCRGLTLWRRGSMEKVAMERNQGTISRCCRGLTLWRRGSMEKVAMERNQGTITRWCRELDGPKERLKTAGMAATRIVFSWT